LANKIAFGAVRNSAGKFVKASPESVSAAGDAAAGGMKGTILASNIWNQPGAEAYPIASFTYLIVYKDLGNVKSAEQAKALADFLWWATHDGQKLAAALDYAPVGANVKTKVEEALRTVTYKGAPLNSAGK